MDTEFEKNRLKPGDAGFVYDKQVDFNIGGNTEGSWDED